MASIATSIYFSYYQSYFVLFLSAHPHLTYELNTPFSFLKLDAICFTWQLPEQEDKNTRERNIYQWNKPTSDTLKKKKSFYNLASLL